jgi:nitric oxide reductase subunit C
MLKPVLFLFFFLASVASSLLVYTTGTRATACNEPAARGKLLYQEHNCTACHQMHGLGGYLGPDLTHAWSRPGKGEAWCRAMLRSGNERMPAYAFDQSRERDILAFLAYVDTAGFEKIPVR